jgi:hypothetical protein
MKTFTFTVAMVGLVVSMLLVVQLLIPLWRTGKKDEQNNGE